VIVPNSRCFRPFASSLPRSLTDLPALHPCRSAHEFGRPLLKSLYGAAEGPFSLPVGSVQGKESQIRGSNRTHGADTVSRVRDDLFTDRYDEQRCH
jgi:hypothetical protein